MGVWWPPAGKRGREKGIISLLREETVLGMYYECIDPDCKDHRFPKDEMYGLTSQLRRAALSIPTNIVEGYSRKGDKELSRFVNIAIGSMAEAEYLLDFSKRLGYLSQQEYESLEALRSGQIAL